MKFIYSALVFILLIAMPVNAEKTNVNDSVKTTVLSKVESWYSNNMNYGSITTLMAVESSFIPFPSEVVVPPAAYVATKQEGQHLNILLIVVFATLGAIIGALVNYFLSLWLGRPIIYKFADSKIGHLLLLSSDKVQKAEDYFNEKGKISTFIGRLVPGIRQLISIPAGLSKMNLGSFILFTALGAGVWNTVLAVLGYVAGNNSSLIYKYYHEISYTILGLVAIYIIYLILKKKVFKKSAK